MLTGLQLISFLLVILQVTKQDFFLTFYQDPVPLHCYDSMVSLFRWPANGHSVCTNQLPNYYSNFPKKYFESLIWYLCQVSKGHLNFSSLSRISTKYLQKLQCTIDDLSIFYQQHYLNWLQINKLKEAEEGSQQDISFFDTVYNWYYRGQILYPMVYEDQLLLQKGAIGSGVFAKCFRVNGFSVSSFSFGERCISKSIYKSLLHQTKNTQLSKFSTLSVDDLLEIEIGVKLLNKESFLIANTVVLTKLDEDLNAVKGYLMDYAEFGNLRDWMMSTPENSKITYELLCNLRTVADAIHAMHIFGYIHSDIKIDNIFVIRKDEGQSSASKAYAFKVGDFGNTCRVGFCRSFSQTKNYEKGEVFPIEMFDKSMKSFYSFSTDWYQFGYLLIHIRQMLLRDDRYRFLQLFGPLIQGLTKYYPQHERIPYSVVKAYLDMVIDEQFLNTSSFVTSFGIRSYTKIETYCNFYNKTTEKLTKIPLVELSNLNGTYFYGNFALIHEMQQIQQTFFCKMAPNGQLKLLIEQEFVGEKSRIYKFLRDFPFKITGSFNFMSPKRYYEGNTIVVDVNSKQFICFCDEFCLNEGAGGKQIVRGKWCTDKLDSYSFGKYLNSINGRRYVSLLPNI